MNMQNSMRVRMCEYLHILHDGSCGKSRLSAPNLTERRFACDLNNALSLILT
jgi:hypothetical protein